jgi:hypothetical protein
MLYANPFRRQGKTRLFEWTIFPREDWEFGLPWQFATCLSRFHRYERESGKHLG